MERWKITSIIKSGQYSNVTNYRPVIAVLSHITKISESLVLDYILSSVNTILIDEKHDFHHSCSATFCK